MYDREKAKAYLLEWYCEEEETIEAILDDCESPCGDFWAFDYTDAEERESVEDDPYCNLLIDDCSLDFCIAYRF